MKAAISKAAISATVVGVLALSGCSPHTEQAVASKPAIGAVATTAAQPGQPGQPGDASLLSYEVAIASAQADRVHALNACDGRQGAPRAACVREADRAYDEARDLAEKIRGSGR